MLRFKDSLFHLISSIISSYAQIFFSKNTLFAIILLIVSFFDFFAGLSGLLAVIISNTTAYLIGFNKFNIKLGYYGFNNLLVGLGLGVYYQPNFEFFMVLFFASLLTLFFTVALEGIVGKYGLPYLSLSFLFVLWMVSLATREFKSLAVSERGIFMLNEMYSLGGYNLVRIYQWFGSLNLPEYVSLYFRSLSAILFQYSLFAGILVALGLLIYSRIAFTLSIFGFGFAYVFYKLIGGNVQELSYGYIGFNFILTSIAIGGFFIVPSRYSFFSVLLLIPLISIILSSSMAVFSLFQISIYSLPFNLIVLTFLYILKFRERNFLSPEIVRIQHFSPEINLYTQKNNLGRFKHSHIIPISLPFWGAWKVTQGEDDEITHKGEWRHAFDFEIEDEKGKMFADTGLLCSDYYCYNKPIIAPADGRIEQIIDYIDDNKIGDVNIENNWGNTIIIRHTDLLFTKISHIKKDSFKVNVGDYVKKGEVLALCGNSGRSPQPHIHFQMQATPFVGSKTLDYPLGHYILIKDGKYILQSYKKPLKNQTVLNIERNKSLYNAYHFIPGQRISFMVYDEKNNTEKNYNWDVLADFYNNTYIYCNNSKSKAYFYNDGFFHYFTHFEGNKKSLLYYFYLSNFKVLTGFYDNLQIDDIYPIHLTSNKFLLFFQDFIAPFKIFLKSYFKLIYEYKNEDFNKSEIEIVSSMTNKIGKHVTKELNFKTYILNGRIEKILINSDNYNIIALRKE
jgi:urea transporter